MNKILTEIVIIAWSAAVAISLVSAAFAIIGAFYPPLIVITLCSAILAIPLSVAIRS